MNRSFAYWTVATGDHAKMMKTCIASARKVGVTEHFHVWTDEPWESNDPNLFFHPVENFFNDHYLFKFEYLRDEVSKLEHYEYFVFLDADNYFVKKPKSFESLLRDNKWFAQLESHCNSKFVKRPDWWGVPVRWYTILMRYKGVPETQDIYNTNAGFWIVRKDAINEFCEKAFEFYSFCREELHLLGITEEVALAYVGHFVNKPELNTYRRTAEYWASDWTGQWVDKRPDNSPGRLPDGSPWFSEEFMTGERHKNNPAIVHVMRAKNLLIAGAK